MTAKPRLISFDICPFVQRSVIILLEKKVDFERIDIDLANPPEWFLAISPFGKVPVLQLGEAVVFESAVINEYLDEVHPPSMQPADPLQRAINKAWTEFASELINNQYRLTLAEHEEHFDLHYHTLRRQLAQLEPVVAATPFFNGGDFCLVDAAFAPAFTRFALLEQRHPMGLLERFPRLQTWSQALVERPSVIHSVSNDFPAAFYAHIGKHQGYAPSLFAGASNS